MKRSPLPRIGLVLALGLMWGGCASTATNPHTPAAVLRVNERGEIARTGFVAMDLVVACANLQRALDEFPGLSPLGRRASIVVEPVKNDTRFALDMAGFNAALYGQLGDHPGINRVFQTEKTAGQASPDYYLAGRLQHLRPLSPEAPTTLLYSFQLIDSRNSEIVCAGTAEIKHRAFPAKG